MIKLNKKYSLVGFGLLAALILALFPTSDFLSKGYEVDSNIKQQNYNEAGIFTVSPFEAAEYYLYNSSGCYWIDVRDAKDFSKQHLKIAINQPLKKLENSDWNPSDLIIVYGRNTTEAQEAVAYLRQVKNVRAFAVKGGFEALRKYLIEPVGISVSNELSDKNLSTLLEARNKISGDKASSLQQMDKLKSSKSGTIKEGC